MWFPKYLLVANCMTHLQGPPFDVGLVAIDPHMTVIHVHVRKNIVEDVLLDGGLGVNIITKDLKK
jgi:hypothetical protein